MTGDTKEEDGKNRNGKKIKGGAGGLGWGLCVCVCGERRQSQNGNRHCRTKEEWENEDVELLAIRGE